MVFPFKLQCGCALVFHFIHILKLKVETKHTLVVCLGLEYLLENKFTAQCCDSYCAVLTFKRVSLHILEMEACKIQPITVARRRHKN